MNDPHFSPDDPRLTAYALGEIEEADRAAVEAALAANPTLRVNVDEIRATAAQLTAALAAEPMTETGSANEEREPFQTEQRLRVKPSFWAKLLRLPQSYYLIGTLSAAAFAVLVWRNQPEAHVPMAQKKYLAVTLPPAGEASNGNAVEEKAASPGGAAGSMAPAAVVVLPAVADEKQRVEDRTDAASPPMLAMSEPLAKEAKDGAALPEGAAANAPMKTEAAVVPSDELAASAVTATSRRTLAGAAADKSAEVKNKADDNEVVRLDAFTVATSHDGKAAAEKWLCRRTVARTQHRVVRLSTRQRVYRGCNRAVVDLLDRRRHGELRERQAFSAQRPPAAARCGAHRRAGELFPVPLRAADGRHAVCRLARSRLSAVGADASARAHRPERARGLERDAAGGEPGFPAGCFRLDERAQQAPAGEGIAAAARESPAAR
jgi:anti-sigma factor RsiW